ncbi:MAG TPA: aminotransferase class III-fold pyridoxal phosphate-dependent enzyme, partial [Streptosporangiaceae bacterium]|nr:aminotransferase class III-fold pyridoxal phosphate-dependent enzyme [Streptosporangiaceae bacterium]
FEQAGIVPDIVCLSKSLSGYGLPLALTLFRRDLDVWEPGEHNGTFRGLNPAFITAMAALGFWAGDQMDQMEKGTLANGEQIERSLRSIADEHADAGPAVRGRGMAWGLEFADPSLASAVCAAAFRRGLLMETAGARDEVVKLMPALTTTGEELAAGLDILADSVRAVRA